MLNKRFLQKVSKFIASNKLMECNEKYLVALSGGADSVALSLALRELGFDVEAAHCNFHLRGDESDRDEMFCRRFCERNGIKLHVTHFDTEGFAKLRKISIEMAARHLRYAYFKQLAEDIGASAVCVAHHQDDSVETVLLNLIRGTGIHGLTGIKPKNGGIVRPLLCVTRNEIETVLAEVGQDFVTDSTNLVDDVVRNKIRLDILPLMKEINPSVSDSIAKTASRIADVADALDDVVGSVASVSVEEKAKGAVVIHTDRLMTGPAPEYVLFRLLKGYSFVPSQIEQIYASVSTGPGRVFISSTHRLLIDRDCIVVEPLAESGRRPMLVPECGVYVYDDSMKLRFERVERDSGFKVSADKCFCFADASVVKFPLTVRTVEVGDRFVPFGMKGSKLVSDYLTDRKFNLFDKQRQLVVADAHGRIVWLVNQRPDERYRITDTTETVLKITCIMS